jgi:hypothetical protein
MSVEFKAKYKEILILALKKLGYQARENNYGEVITNVFTFDLQRQKVSFPAGYTAAMNEIKRKYSEIVLEQVAKKRRWILKNKAGGNFQLIKY